MKKYLILSFTILIIPLYAQRSDSSENKNSGIMLRSTAAPGQNTPLFIITAENRELRVESAKANSLTGEEPLNEINPKWIQSITVLKGKTTTDKYGPSGQSGVILIELKDGILENMPVGLREKFKIQ